MTETGSSLPPPGPSAQAGRPVSGSGGDDKGEGLAGANETTLPTPRIHSLPKEILAKVFEFLSVRDKIMAEDVCNRWRNTLREGSGWAKKNILCYEDVCNAVVVAICLM